MNINTTPLKETSFKENVFLQKDKGNIQSSPSKNSSSKFIETLHKEIDELKLNNLKLKNANDEQIKKNELISKKRDQLIEQLSNCKHENDIVNALLKRKERRINDLEEQVMSFESNLDDLNFKFKKYESYKKELDLKVIEMNKLEINYDSLLIGQKQYREHYNKEVEELRNKLKDFIEEKNKVVDKNINLINKSDTHIYRSLKSINLRSIEYEERYKKKNEIYSKIVDRLVRFSNKQHCDIKEVRNIIEDVALEIGMGKEEFDRRLKQYQETVREEEENEKMKEKKKKEREEEFQEEQEKSKQQTREESKEQSKEQNKHKHIRKELNMENTMPKMETHKHTDGKDKVEVEIPIQKRIVSLGKELNATIPVTDRDSTFKVTPKTTPKKKRRNKKRK